ncbi:MAG: hypothetical protein AAGD38_14655 [Acidobacteriota bacterium]
MNLALPIAAALLILIGLVHSYLGERYILIRLFRRDLPKLFGDDWFTRRTLRFAWHLLTVACFGFAAILIVATTATDFRHATLLVIAATFLITALIAGGFTKGRHLSWVVFLVIAVLTYLAA